MERSAMRVGLLAGVVLALIAAPVWAQTADTAQIPDYAAVLGSNQVVRDAATGKRRGLTQNEVQRRLNADGVKRTARQRRESRGLNETLHAMPATVEEALRTAKKNSQGIVIINTSREEIHPIVGVVDGHGGMQASHDDADLRRDDR